MPSRLSTHMCLARAKTFETKASCLVYAGFSFFFFSIVGRLSSSLTWLRV